VTQTMKMYPIMLKLQGRRTVVVGGGAVGLRKAQTLVEAGAEVTLVATELGGQPPQGATVLRRPYAPETVEGAYLVFACTDDEALNSRIADDARAAGALVNAVDQPDDCDFYVPAIVSDGDVTVAIGTAGASPALAGNLKRRIAAVLGPGIGEFAALLRDLRSQLRAAEDDLARRGRIMKDLSSDETYDLLVTSGPEAIRTRFMHLLKS